MKAVLMAGGFGTRIQPLTHSVPKPMVPLLNRPMMEPIVAALREAGIREIVVLLYHMPDVIRDYFGDGADFGVKFHYVLPEDDFGTAGAVKKAAHFLDSTFLVLSGDIVSDFDLEKIVAFHKQHGSPVTITLTHVPNPLEFGVVITNGSGRILRFLEKPGWGEVFSDTVNTGVYVFEPSILHLIPDGSFFDFSKDLFPIYMREDIPIYGYAAEGYWRDVGNPDAYREAVTDALTGKAKIPLPGVRHERGDDAVWIEEPEAMPPASVTIRGTVLLGRGARIGEGAELDTCVVGPDCVVGEGARLARSVLWRGARVGPRTVLNDVVLCDDVRVGSEVRMEKGAVVGHGTEVGEGAAFERDLMVWPNKMIEEGSTLSSNMVWGDRWKKAVFEGGFVRGSTNVELSPEFAAKLGAAMGSLLAPGSSILVSRDYLRASRMLKRAFLGGILSTGVNVHDVKMCATPVARHKLSGFGEEAGVHFQQAARAARKTEIAFYDHEGNLVDTAKEKAIERLFFKENFRRVDHAEVGAIQEIQGVADFYNEAYVRSLDADAVRAHRYRVVLDLGYGTTGNHLPLLMNNLGCQPVVLNGYPDERRLMRRSDEQPEALRQVGQIVTTLGADMGVCLSPDGEEMWVVDDTGTLHPPDRTAMLFVKLIAAASPAPVKVFLPVTEPHVLDAAANLRVIRGKTTSVKTSELHDFAFVSQGGARYAFPDFLHAPDGMYAVAKLLELLARSETRLSQLYAALPPYAQERREVACPVEKKGFIMRRMSEDSVDKQAEFLDGVQIFFEGRSVLLLPDPYRPVLHLVAEGPDQEAASTLVAEYEAKVIGWLAAG